MSLKRPQALNWAVHEARQRLHLNIKTDADVQWISLEDWDACTEEVMISDLVGKRCFAGLDLAQTRDITAFVLFFPYDGNVIIPYCFVPHDTASARLEKDRINYIAWADEGLLELTEGNVCDYEFVRKKINELGEVFDIVEIAFDRWGATEITTNLGKDGFEMVTFGQGYASMSAPTKHLEKLILSNDLIHNNHKVLRWCISNVMVEEDAAGNLKPSKKKSEQKIDPIVAAIMAIGRAIVSEGDFDSIYDTRGILTIDGEEEE